MGLRVCPALRHGRHACPRVANPSPYHCLRRTLAKQQRPLRSGCNLSATLLPAWPLKWLFHRPPRAGLRPPDKRPRSLPALSTDFSRRASQKPFSLLMRFTVIARVEAIRDVESARLGGLRGEPSGTMSVLFAFRAVYCEKHVSADCPAHRTIHLRNAPEDIATNGKSIVPTNPTLCNCRGPTASSV